MRNSLSFNNYSMLVEREKALDWYDWCLFAAGPKEAIQAVREIEYRLHPTFPNPIRIVKDKNTRFALFSTGWGEFTVDIEVLFEDGERIEREYFLQLAEDNWPRFELPSGADEDVRKVYLALFHKKYRWRKLETAVRGSGMEELAVRGILEELEAKNLVRRAYFKSIDNKELWGATAVVGISPRLELDR
ncbi:MAG: pYEATS domain-containing protein [Candidatus Hodarchaeota archaeon]